MVAVSITLHNDAFVAVFLIASIVVCSWLFALVVITCLFLLFSVVSLFFCFFSLPPSLFFFCIFCPLVIRVAVLILSPVAPPTMTRTRRKWRRWGFVDGVLK